MGLYEKWVAKLARRRAYRDRRKAAVVKAQKTVEQAKRKVKKYEPTPAAVALKWAESKVGITESPAGSNRGPEISKWQRETAGIDSAPWCGAFVGYALKQAKVAITGRIVFTPYILEDARAGRNGFEKLVPWGQGKKGDLVLMDFAPGGAPVMHVGMLRADQVPGSGWAYTVEGNTSAGASGSQDNGGGVFRRERARSVVVGIARPRW